MLRYYYYMLRTYNFARNKKKNPVPSVADPFNFDMDPYPDHRIRFIEADPNSADQNESDPNGSGSATLPVPEFYFRCFEEELTKQANNCALVDLNR